MSNMTQKHQMSLTPPEHHWLGIIVTRPRSHTSTSWGRNNKRQFSTSISHVFSAMSQKDFLYFLKRLLILKIRYFPNQSLCGFLAYILARPYYRYPGILCDDIILSTNYTVILLHLQWLCDFRAMSQKYFLDVTVVFDWHL